MEFELVVAWSVLDGANKTQTVHSVHQKYKQWKTLHPQAEGLEQLRLRVALAENERPGGLRAVANIINNIAAIADNLSSRFAWWLWWWRPWWKV